MAMLQKDVGPGRRDTLFKRTLSVLESRLPYSCFMINQLKLHNDLNMNDDLKIYCFDEGKGNNMGSDDDEPIIVLKFPRGTWGHCISISSSAHEKIKEKDNQEKHSDRQLLPKTTQNFFDTGGIIDWTQPFVLLCQDHRISNLLISLNLRKYFNSIKIFPSHLFYMDPVDAMKLEVPSIGPSFEVRPLTSAEADKSLIQKWGHTRPGTIEYIHKCVENNLTCGIIIDGEVVCAALMPALDGAIEGLFTPPPHRRKGYASILTKYMLREMARKGLQPCLYAEISDKSAVAFHKSVNPRIIGDVDYICH